MNEYKRVPSTDESFEELHGIKPEVYRQVINNNNINSKLIFNGKEIILNETLEKGLTKQVTLTYNGEIRIFDKVYLAEKEATKILRS